MNIVKWVFAILLFGLAVVLVTQNYIAMKTPVNLVFFNYETAQMPLAVVAILTFVVGVVAVGVYALAVTFRLKKRIRRLTLEAKAREKELNSLRNLPVTTEVIGSEETSGTPANDF